MKQPVRECPGLCGHTLHRADLLCAECVRKLPPQLRVDIRRTWDAWRDTFTRDAFEAYTRCMAYAVQTAKERNGQTSDPMRTA